MDNYFTPQELFIRKHYMDNYFTPQELLNLIEPWIVDFPESQRKIKQTLCGFDEVYTSSGALEILYVSLREHGIPLSLKSENEYALTDIMQLNEGITSLHGFDNLHNKITAAGYSCIVDQREALIYALKYYDALKKAGVKHLIPSAPLIYATGANYEKAPACISIDLTYFPSFHVDCWLERDKVMGYHNIGHLCKILVYAAPQTS